MTKEELIDMARQSGWEYAHDESGFEPLWTFAKLVAEREREKCAKLCDVLAVHPEYASEVTKLAAQAIRNRGQA